MIVRYLSALAIFLSVAGCQPTADSIKTDSTVAVPELAAGTSLAELGGKWAGYWTGIGSKGSIAISGADTSTLKVKLCHPNLPCRNIEKPKLEGGAILWTERNRRFTFWLEGGVLRGVLKEYRSERWWTYYVWMERIGSQSTPSA